MVPAETRLKLWSLPMHATNEWWMLCWCLNFSTLFSSTGVFLSPCFSDKLGPWADDSGGLTATGQESLLRMSVAGLLSAFRPMGGLSEWSDREGLAYATRKIDSR